MASAMTRMKAGDLLMTDSPWQLTARRECIPEKDARHRADAVASVRAACAGSTGIGFAACAAEALEKYPVPAKQPCIGRLAFTAFGAQQFAQ